MYVSDGKRNINLNYSFRTNTHVASTRAHAHETCACTQSTTIHTATRPRVTPRCMLHAHSALHACAKSPFLRPYLLAIYSANTCGDCTRPRRSRALLVGGWANPVMGVCVLCICLEVHTNSMCVWRRTYPRRKSHSLQKHIFRIESLS